MLRTTQRPNLYAKPLGDAKHKANLHISYVHCPNLLFVEYLVQKPFFLFIPFFSPRGKSLSFQHRTG